MLLPPRLPLSLWPALWLASFAWMTYATQDDNFKSINLRTHSLAQPYLDSDMQSRWFDYGGDTIVRLDSYVRLTSDRPSQSGWLWSRVPFTASNWEIEVEFKIHGKRSLYGDGFAMWMTKGKAQQGSVFGSANDFEGLGIFFDTYKNNRPGTVFPLVMAMVGDGKTSYDKDDDGKLNELASCSARGIRHASVPTKMRATYLQEKMLKLELQYRAEEEWTLCFEIANPPVLPAVSYLGFSAETGELSDCHDIISIRSSNLYSNRAPSSSSFAGNSQGRKSPFGEGSSSTGSWTWFLFRIVILFLVIGGAYVGFTIWRSRRNMHRF